MRSDRESAKKTATAGKGVPLYPFSDYEPGVSPDTSVFLTRFEAVPPHLSRNHWHRHNYYQFFWVDGGEYWSDFTRYRITERSLVFASPGQIHQWKTYDQTRGTGISFTQEFFDGALPPPSRLLKHLYWFPANRPPILPLGDTPLAGEIETLVAEIWREFKARGKDYLSVIRCLLHALFIRASRGYETLHPWPSEPSMRQILREFRITLEANVNNNISVADMAKIMRISAERLGEASQEHAGCTPGDLIRERLLLEAKRLLAHSRMTISEIAHTLNFNDPAYFGRFFRRLTGETPGAFREKHQG